MTIEVAIEKRLGRDFHLRAEFTADNACLGILGPSGCGKSLILKCIAGVETPDRGRIAINGRVLFDSERKINLRPQQRRVGFLFQNYALFPRMTVEQNISVGVSPRNREKADLVADLIRRFQLDGLEKRLPEQLSGGQQQRTALARMLAADPELLLLDEPFSALDTHLREYMQLRLLAILKDRRDAILVTHSRDEAYRLCPELLVLDRGGVLGRGTTKELFSLPGTVRVAKLTGCKNISRMKRIGDGRLYALDWGLTLNAARPIPDTAAYVGVRAHDLAPIHDESPALDNLVEPLVREQTEDLFEWNVIFTNAGARNTSEQADIWWKIGKGLFNEMPRRLRIPPEALLFLREDAEGSE